jgi:hypothetical protein
MASGLFAGMTLCGFSLVLKKPGKNFAELIDIKEGPP